MATKKGTAGSNKKNAKRKPAAKKAAVKKAAPKKPSKPAADRRKMNAGEAIINFVGLLTTRKSELIFGGSNDCAPIMTIASEFMNSNKLPEVRDDFPISKLLPDSMKDLTNVPSQSVNMRTLTPEETFRNIIQAIRTHDVNHQNEIVANLLMELEASRVSAVNAFNKDMETLKTRGFEVNHVLDGFKSIRDGGYEKLAFKRYDGIK